MHASTHADANAPAILPETTRRLLQFVANCLILVGAHLIGVQIRLRVALGQPLGEGYDAQPPQIYLLIVASVALAYTIAVMASRSPSLARYISPRNQFRVLLLSIAFTASGILLLVPDFSQLQLIYLAVVAVIVGVLVIVLPGRFNPSSTGSDVFAALDRLAENRSLLGLWLRYNIEARYSQTILGILWIVLLPLSTAGVLALAFSQILRVGYDVPFVSFFFTALVFWGLFNNSIFNSMQALISRMGLINQVNFPREVIILVVIGEALVDLMFTFIALVIINALNGISPNIQWIYLPSLLLILVMFTLGLMFILSTMAVFVRDVPQLVSVALQLLFYLTPILYPVSAIPESFRFIVLINPIGLVLQAFRDVLIYARPPDPLSLYYPLVAAVVLLYTGYAYFKANEERLADMI